MTVTINGTTGITTPDLTSTDDISANGVPFGKGGGSVSSNIAIGTSALSANTSGSQNFSAGVNALDSVTTGTDNVAIGNSAGQAVVTASGNVFVGVNAGAFTTGNENTFVGSGVTGTDGGAGFYVTSGTKNTIVGKFDGNMYGLDIRTLSNVCVVADGDGAPQLSTYRIDSSSQYGNFDITAGVSGGGASNAWVISAGTATAFSGFGGGFMSGVMVINDISVTGSTAMFIFGGASTVTKIAESAGTNNFQVNSSTPTGQQTGLYFSGATLYIKPAQTTYYRIWVLRTRTSL